jgi:hypothetical protein
MEALGAEAPDAYHERVNSSLGWSLAEASAADWSRTWLIAADRPEKMGRDL